MMTLNENQIKDMIELHDRITRIYRSWTDIGNGDEPEFDEDSLGELEMYALQDAHDLLGKILLSQEKGG